MSSGEDHGGSSFGESCRLSGPAVAASLFRGIPSRINLHFFALPALDFGADIGNGSSPHMKPAVNYSNDLRQKLAQGRTLDQALSELRTSGASIFDCIASLKTLRRCDLAEAKKIVQSSPAWSDHRDVTQEFLQGWSDVNESQA